ncbi:MAG TPA: hypothetical protein PLO56_15225 [Rhodothermales bacterium]|nr:hypothetical protein [Rhodothermales bacterium]
MNANPKPMNSTSLPLSGTTRKDESLSYQLANIVSYTLNPLTLSPIGAALWSLHFGGSKNQVWAVIGITTFFFCVLPLLYLVWMVKTGRTSSVEVREREARNAPMIFGMFSAVIGGWALIQFTSLHPVLTVALIAMQIANTILMLTITQWWKISLHMTGMSGFVASQFYITQQIWGVPTLDIITPIWVWPLFLTIPLLMWSRIRVGAHTPMQVLAGAGLAFPATYATLHLVFRWMYNLVF